VFIRVIRGICGSPLIRDNSCNWCLFFMDGGVKLFPSTVNLPQRQVGMLGEMQEGCQ